MKIHTHASSSKGNMFEVERGNDTIIIDAGVKKDLTADILAITHAHEDHSKYIGFYIERVKKVTTSLEVLESLSLKLDGYTFSKIQAKYTIPEFENMETLTMAHDLPCVGFLIFDATKTYMHVTDTTQLEYEPIMEIDLLSIEANHDIDMLMQSDRPEELKQRIITNGHLSNEKAREIVDKIKPKQVNLIHISNQANSESCIEKAFKNIEYKIKGSFIL